MRGRGPGERRPGRRSCASRNPIFRNCPPRRKRNQPAAPIFSAWQPVGRWRRLPRVTMKDAGFSRARQRPLQNPQNTQNGLVFSKGKSLLYVLCSIRRQIGYQYAIHGFERSEEMQIGEPWGAGASSLALVESKKRRDVVLRTRLSSLSTVYAPNLLPAENTGKS